MKFISWIFSDADETDNPSRFPTYKDKVYCFMLALVCTSIFCLNLTVIILYMLKKNLQRKIQNFMLCHSSIIGTFNGVTFYVVLLLFFNNILLLKTQKYLTLLGLYSVNLTVTSLLFMSLERYLSITNQRFYRALQNRCSVKLFATTLWLLSAFTLGIYWLGKSHIIVFIFLVAIECFIIMTLLQKSSTAVRQEFKNAVEAARKARNLNGIYFLKRKQERDRRFFRILFGMMVMFFISFLPWATATLFYTFFPHTRDNGTFKLLTRYSIIFYLGSAIVNPILTLTLKDDYKNLFTKFWQRTKNKRFDKEMKHCDIVLPPPPPSP